MSHKSKPTDKSYAWLGTFNNPPKEVVEDLEPWLGAVHEKAKARYTNGQLEKCPTTGTIHV